jgi:N6-L-threonylcarbamoyladenine synthase
MKILAIESSCDEFAAAVVADGRRVLAEVIQSQIDLHKAYGGVVPEVAARSHLEIALPVVDECLQQFAKKQKLSDPWDAIDAIAVTHRPGLIGSLLIGTLTARTLALLKNKPLYAVNHIEGHVYANFLLPKAPKFPMLALVVSGGHTQLMLFTDHGHFEIIGQTVDDAVGEAFDKVAKILGLPYPGGPSIAQAATLGDPHKHPLPTPHLKDRHNFSFSGLKTALLRAVQAEVGVDHTFPSHALSARLTTSQRQDFAASFQKVAVESLSDKLAVTVAEYQPKSVVIAGGVAANRELRRVLSEKLPQPINYASLNWCTDNAAMIGAAAYFQAQKTPPVNPRELAIIPTK